MSHGSTPKRPLADMMILVPALLFVTSSLLVTSSAYPGGVPDLACESMFPSGHEASASTEVAPFFITIPTSTYRPGETVKVNVFSKRGHYFSGIYVQARRVGCHLNETEVIGRFTAVDPLLETHHCFDQVHTAVSHTSGVKKTGSSFYWTAPVVPSGHVVMRATIVKDKSIFWTNVDSAPLVDLQNDDTPFCVSHTHRKDFHFDHSKSRSGLEAKTSHLDGDTGSTWRSHCWILVSLILLNIIICYYLSV